MRSVYNDKFRWPRVPSHDKASCFNCGGDFGDRGWWSDSGYGPGNGQWMQHCCRCGETTYYDLETSDNAAA
jgi:hypothetical protein